MAGRDDGAAGRSAVRPASCAAVCADGYVHGRKAVALTSIVPLLLDSEPIGRRRQRTFAFPQVMTDEMQVKEAMDTAAAEATDLLTSNGFYKG